MPSITGSRKGKKANHHTVTESASGVYQHLRDHGFITYPGVIKPHGGANGLRINITAEKTRVRITVNFKGSQDLHLYGPVDVDKLELTLKELNPISLTIRA